MVILKRAYWRRELHTRSSSHCGDPGQPKHPKRSLSQVRLQLSQHYCGFDSNSYSYRVHEKSTVVVTAADIFVHVVDYSDEVMAMLMPMPMLMLILVLMLMMIMMMMMMMMTMMTMMMPMAMTMLMQMMMLVIIRMMLMMIAMMNTMLI